MMRKREMKTTRAILLLMAAVLVMTVGLSTSSKVYAQVPENCGESFENRCVVENEEDAEEIQEEFPDAQVEVNEEFYNEIPDEGVEIDEMEARDEDEDGDEDEDSGDEDSGESGSSSTEGQAPPGGGGDILPGDTDNFQPIPPGNENLPPAQQSGAGLKDACLQSGFTEAQCNNYLFSDDPGGYCSTLKLAGVPCPKIQDPAFTYGNPEAAREQSEQQIENTERAIQGFEQTVPNNLGEGFAMK
jgi:hypothetical protein